MDLSKDEKAVIKQLCLLTMKPVMYVANVEEDGFENNALLEEFKAVCVEEKALLVSVCAKIEAEISDLPDEEKQICLEDIGMHDPGLNRVIRAAYQLLGLDT